MSTKEDQAMRIRILPVLAALAAGVVVPLAPRPARCSAQPAEHVVLKGDNLHLLAGYYYRDPRQWRKIWELNKASVSRPSHLVPGRTLRVESTPGVTWDIPYEEFRSRVRGQ
jgi:nucleoid-associated protein YgaU